MLTDEFVQSLFHDYDAVKRHEYYIKTRELKGRQPGQKQITGDFSRSKVVVTSGTHRHPVAKTNHHHFVTSNLEALKTRLEALRSILADLVKAAKGRSGVKATPAEKAKHHREKSKLSSTQRAAAAKRSKAYYQKHKGDPASQVSQIKTQIKEIKAKIEALKAKLHVQTIPRSQKDTLKSAVSSTNKHR